MTADRVGDTMPLDGSGRSSISQSEWTYRVAQNPRWIWLPATLFVLLIAVLSFEIFLDDPGRATASFLCFGITMLSLGVVCPVVGGFTHLRPPQLPSVPTRPIPTTPLWQVHLPVLAGIFAMAAVATLEYLEPQMSLGSRYTPPRLLATAVVLYAFVAASLLVVGHRHVLRFTPHALEHHRGRFRATVPWSEIRDLRPIGDANLKSGRANRIYLPSRRNLRAGVQLAVGDGVSSRGRGKRFRINGIDVINIDCSGYTIEPNTLINAIYLLVENPGLRPLLNSSEGAELFVGPDWNTRRKMRVGDQWDRTTGTIVRAGRKLTP